MVQQTRIEYQRSKNAVYVDTTIYQPETPNIPWAVHVEGWTDGKMAVTIYHEQIKSGMFRYVNCRFNNGISFAEFVRKQLVMYKTAWHKNISIRGIDYQALVEGYEKGIKEAGNVRIVSHRRKD